MTRHATLCAVEGRHRALLIPLVLLFVLLTACGGDGGGAPRPSGTAADDEVLLEGREIWVANCARCHGSEGRGGMGPSLANDAVVERYPEIDDQLEVVRAGRGAMPAWEGQLTSDEIEAVVRYTREVL